MPWERGDRGFIVGSKGHAKRGALSSVVCVFSGYADHNVIIHGKKN